MTRIDLAELKMFGDSEAGPQRKTRGLEVIPTMVVGLGGTGTKILSLFKRRIRSILGPEAPVSFLGLDTAHERLPGAPLDSDEMALCECPQASQIVKRLEDYPDIAEWWLDDIPHTEVTPATDGAQMKRFMGRLACFSNFKSEILWRLRKQIKKLRPVGAQSKRASFSVQERKMRVYVVGSLSGGTGGGFFFDIALAIRDAAQQIAGAGIVPIIVGVIVLPGGYIDVVPMNFMRQKIQANFYAGMKEIEYLSRHHPEFTFKLGGSPVPVESPPFDTIYLLDTLNQAGRNIESVSGLYAMAASELCMEVCSSITQEVESALCNARDEVAKVSHGRKCFYGSFATAGLEVPTPRLLEYSGFRYACELLADVLETHPEDDSVTQANAILGQLGVLHGGQERLTTTLRAEGVKGISAQVAPQLSKKNARKAALVATGEWKKVNASRSGLGAAETRIAELAEGAIERLRARLRKSIDAMLGGEQGCGLNYTTNVTRGLTGKLMALHESIRKRIESLPDVLVLAEQAKKAHATISRRRKGLALLSRGGQQAGYEDFAAAVNKWCNAVLEKATLDAARNCYEELLKEVKRIRNALKQVADSVSRLCQDLQGAAEQRRFAGGSARQSDYALLESVVAPEHFPEIYADLKRKIDPTICAEAIRPPEGSLAKLRTTFLIDVEPLLNDTVFPALDEAFRPLIERLDVLEAAEKYSDLAVSDWIKRALTQCQPFCNFDRVATSSECFSQTYIGVPDRNSSRYTRVLGDVGSHKLVSTGNYNEIRIYSLMTGLPAYAVTGIDRCRQIYKEYCRLAKKESQLHVHIDRRWTDPGVLPDLFPEGR